jgi:hypothetical protein
LYSSLTFTRWFFSIVVDSSLLALISYVIRRSQELIYSPNLDNCADFTVLLCSLPLSLLYICESRIRKNASLRNHVDSQPEKFSLFSRPILSKAYQAYRMKICLKDTIIRSSLTTRRTILIWQRTILRNNFTLTKSEK